MRNKLFRTLAALLGAAWIVLGVLVIISVAFDRPTRFLGALALIGTGVYFINYSVTGRTTLFAHRIRRAED